MISLERRKLQMLHTDRLYHVLAYGWQIQFRCPESNLQNGWSEGRQILYIGRIHQVLALGGQTTPQMTWSGSHDPFLANVNYVTFAICYRRSVCRLSVVWNVGAPTQPLEIFRNFFLPYDRPGTLVFWCQKSLVGDTPFFLKFALKVTHPTLSSVVCLSSETLVHPTQPLEIFGNIPPFHHTIDQGL